MKKIYFLVAVLCLFDFANAQVVNIPDFGFRSQLFNASTTNGIAKNLAGNDFVVDANNNGQIEVSEATQVSSLNLLGRGILNLTGIDAFVNLTDLDCSQNQIETLDFSSNPLLYYLECGRNHLTYLNVSSNSQLTVLGCGTNALTSLSLSNLPNLRNLFFSGNSLTTINISSNLQLASVACDNNLLTALNADNLLNLVDLRCDNNQLTNLTLNNVPNLKELRCRENQLTALSLSNMPFLENLLCDSNSITSLTLNNFTNLETIYCISNQLNSLVLNNMPSLRILACRDNQLTSLNLNSTPVLNELTCSQNQLNSLFLKNGANENIINFEYNPNLRYICVDEIQKFSVLAQLDFLNITNVQVNTYCSFNPGGTFYTIQGTQKYDLNNNGCDSLDNLFPNLNYSISNGTSTSSIISDSSGNFSIPVTAATHTINPILENPSYFNVSPTNAVVTFPTQTSSVTQNFCVTANGSHPDLEINMLPINPARPGFDSEYKLIYKNKGNISQSGTINLTFNDSVLDLVSAVPTAAIQTLDNLSWNFTNLQPFETREITFILNVNSPMETPAVNAGDQLNFTAIISSPNVDEDPTDSGFDFNQTVVNSFDPNDKTCLEGATISQAKVGDYLHYMIRFENTGTFPAQNIVVKDMIDLTKFDINSLIPIKGSHSFVTNVSAGNKVEFIFENINLPFDNANNDGYVAFKIKTKSTLVNGNTFSNTASIYFDYNFPIITNTATTTIQALANQNFEFASYFTIYPNPAKDFLKIDFKNSIEVQSINIYNTVGQLVLVIPNAQNTNNVDVSSLKSGNYFVKINSDKGTSSSKFIKQ